MATSTTEAIEVALRDGRRVTIRPIRRDDVARTAAFIDALSPQSKHSLFLGGIAKLSDAALQRLLKTGYKHLSLSRKSVRKPDETLYHTLEARIHTHKLIHTHYQHVDGTSVAAPIISSLIALMLEANPALQPGQVRAILQQTAVPVAGISAEKQGAGAINVRGALEAAR